jgi:hypothetical protein
MFRAPNEGELVDWLRALSLAGCPIGQAEKANAATFYVRPASHLCICQQTEHDCFSRLLLEKSRMMKRAQLARYADGCLAVLLVDQWC